MNPLIKDFVVNKRKSHYDIYIGRGSKWGNPFKLEDYSRRDSILNYVLWLSEQPELLRDLPSLKGKVLGCYCAPKRCHGEVLALLANGHMTIDHLVKVARKALYDVGLQIIVDAELLSESRPLYDFTAN